MATTNVPMTGAWGKIADAGVDFCVSFVLNDEQEGPLPKSYIVVEVAVSDADSAPTIDHGRPLVVGGPDRRNEGITRDQTGDGYLYGRLIGSHYPIVAVVDAR